MPAPAPLAENLPFSFRGERIDPARVVPATNASRLRAAQNATGKPNSDVLREFIGLSADGEERRSIVIDFPAAMSEAEARLYAAPFAALARSDAALHSPNLHQPLRTALARLERFLAAPADDTDPTFVWIEGDVLPDDSLVVWARDDDFSAAVLASRAFAAWCDRRGDLVAALRSFPFPWPPATPLSSLSRAQEDNRFALARAARSEDRDAIEAALGAAYGWPAELTDAALVERLDALHATRR